MGFTMEEGMVRADRFRESGKWYDTFALPMAKVYNEPRTHEAVHVALNALFAADGYPCASEGWFVVVLDPYNMHSHPIVAWGRKDGTWGFSDKESSR
jgi:hypothetical protein